MGLDYTLLGKYIRKSISDNYVFEQSGELSFDEVFSLAIRNNIEYPMFSQLVHCNSYTDEQREKMRVRLRQSVMRTLVQNNELNQMSDLFEKRGIKNQPLKGAVMKSIYPSPEMREMSDIDILIAADDMVKADEVLKEMGYSLKESVKHHDVYKKVPFMIVEAHKTLYDKTVDNNQYVYFESFENTQLKIDCKYTYEFTPEAFYVYMIAHMAKHFYAMGCGIRNLVDIYVYLNKYGDSLNFESIDNELKKCGIYDFEKNTRKLAFDWLEGKKLDSFYESLFYYMCDSGIYGKDENGIWNKFAQEEERKISKFELKRWYIFPPLYYMAELYPWLEDHHGLLPVAWFIRLCRGVFKHKGEKKRQMMKSISDDKIMTYQRIYKRMNLKFKH